MALREYHRPKEPKSASQLLRRTQPITIAIYLSPRPSALHNRKWEAAVDLSNLGLDRIQTESDGSVRNGVLTPLQDIVDAQHLKQYAGGLLPKCAHIAGHLGLRNVANIGGVLTTEKGAPELRLALLALDARHISTDGFITELRLPAQTLLTSLHRVARTPLDEAIVAVAVALRREDNIVTQARVTVSGISSTPVRIETSEEILTSQALTPSLIDKAAAATVSAADHTYDDYRGSSEYRREMACLLTRRAVETAWQREFKT